jgi:hypothetical protein
MPQTLNSACNLIASGTGNNATATATINAVAGQSIWLAGLLISGEGATAAAGVTATLTGLVGGTVNIAVGVPSGAGNLSQLATFDPPLQGLPNTAIVLTVPAFGAGSNIQGAMLWGWASQS